MTEPQHTVVFFSGHVHGVGFRYTTLQIAKEFEVAGFVMNLPDGRVQVEAEGQANQIKDFLETIQERLHGYIRKTEQKTVPSTAQFRGFVIK